MRAERFLEEWNVRVSVRGDGGGYGGGRGRLTSDCWQKSQARQLPLIHYIAKPIVSVRSIGLGFREGSDREGLKRGGSRKASIELPGLDRAAPTFTPA